MLINKLNQVSILAVAICSVAIFTSCKSSESAYKKAYDKAKAQTIQNQQTVAEDNTQTVKIAPVPTTTTTTDVSNEPVRKEDVTLVSGAGLNSYSVVCGSFTLKANAEGLQQTLKGKGYSAQIVYNPSNKFYRVVAVTSDDKGSVVQSRNTLRSSYPDAWLLLKEK